MVLLTFQPLDPQAITARVRAPSNGAVLTFLGTVRDHTEGRRVLYLEYEAFQEMAERMMRRILEEVREKWGVTSAAVAHRLGRLEVGEVSMVVAVGAPHRAEAFLACEYIVDRIKQIVPIWKKEHFEGGEVWVGTESAYQVVWEAPSTGLKEEAL